MDKKIINMFWTAGLDSTYRLVELSRMEGLTIQPHYVKGKRKSANVELDRIEKILDNLRNRKETKSEILAPIVHIQKDLVIDREVVEAFINFKKYMKLGTQYKMLSAVAREYPGIELSIERDDVEKHAFEKKKITLNKITTEVGDTWVVDETADKNAYTIFKNITFPIATITKQDELDRLTEWGYQDVMKLTWFCHIPKKNKAKEYVPCGYCNPCTQYVETGLTYLFDEKALHRYKHRKFYYFPTAVKFKLLLLKSKIFKKD